MLIFNILEEGLGLVIPPHFTYDFSRKVFLFLYSTNWPNFTVWLLLVLEILSKIFVVIICYPVCDFINFEISLSFLMNPIFNIIKNSGQKWLKNEKSLYHEIRSIFHHFWSGFIEANKSNFFGRWEYDFKYIRRERSCLISHQL